MAEFSCWKWFSVSVVLQVGAIHLVQQTNFNSYRLLRGNEMPELDVHLVDSEEAPGGIGEAAVPPVAPAICNAIFAATGKRLRELPIARRLSEYSA